MGLPEINNDRTSDPPDEGERPSGVAVIVRCVICEDDPQHRRGCCRRCYRKFSDAGLPLPERTPPGRRPGDAAQQWAAALTDGQKLRLLRLLLGSELAKP
jgi:hypothetical protein